VSLRPTDRDYQDTLALVMAQRTNRTIRLFTQGLATAVFLPI
jgi:hypothetical protein